MLINYNATDLGTLYVVATPIGNMQDITFRAVDVLKSVDMVAAEDTRRTGTLLKYLGISANLMSCREHNERKAAEKINGFLKQGMNVAFVTDAGTPGISDPAGRLVRAVRSQGYSVLPVPGPSAAAAVMSVSGFTASSFYFAGFLPSKQHARREVLKELASLPVPIVFFEAPHRLLQSVADMQKCLGDREVFVAREMTKLHESGFSGLLSELLTHIDTDKIRGEITMVVQGANIREPLDDERIGAVETLVNRMMADCIMSARDVAVMVSRATGIRRGRIYDMANMARNR